MPSPEDKEPAVRVKSRIGDDIARKRFELRILLDNEMGKLNGSIENILPYYRTHLPSGIVLSLVEDIQRQGSIYSNMLEEIKKIPLDDLGGYVSTKGDPVPDDHAGTRIKQKYERLGLVATGVLPNPSAKSLANDVLDRIHSLGRALLRVISDHGPELMRDLELQVQPDTTFTMEVEVGVPPKLSLGIDRATPPRP